jgi:uncharacterized membrane protein
MTLLPGLDAAPNLHPMLVHFPVALWLTALALWGASAVSGNKAMWKAGCWCLGLGTLGGVLSAATGFLGTNAMGHDSPGHALIHVHRNIMVATTILATAVTGLAFWKTEPSRGLRWGLVACLALTTALMTVGADRGAELVYRYGVGVLNEQPPGAAGHGAHDHGGHAH